MTVKEMIEFMGGNEKHLSKYKEVISNNINEVCEEFNLKPYEEDEFLLDAESLILRDLKRFNDWHKIGGEDEMNRLVKVMVIRFIGF